MTLSENNKRRCLAIYSTSRSFGFAVLETPLFLVDWGVRSVRRVDVGTVLLKCSSLITFYRPDVIITAERLSRRRRAMRLRRLLARCGDKPFQEGTRILDLAPDEMEQRLLTLGATTKRGIAQAVAEKLPELAPHLPPPRKPWMTEDQRMGFFIAAALALTCADSMPLRT